MIVVIYLLRQSITLYKNLGGGLEQNMGGLEPLSPIASAATDDDDRGHMLLQGHQMTVCGL